MRVITHGQLAMVLGELPNSPVGYLMMLIDRASRLGDHAVLEGLQRGFPEHFLAWSVWKNYCKVAAPTAAALVAELDVAVLTVPDGS